MTDVEMQLDSIRNYKFNIKAEDKDSYLERISISNCPIETDLVYSRLNNKTTINTEDNKSLYSSTSDKRCIAKSDHELLNKVVVHTQTPYDVYTSKAFSYTICKKVVSIKIDNNSFSYLNSPQSDDHSFYININEQTNKFELIDQIIFDIEVYKHLHIPYEVLATFVKELNKTTQDIPMEFNKLMKCYLIKNVVKIILLYALLVIMCLGSFLQIEEIFKVGKAFGYSVFSVIGVYILIVIYITYLLVTSKHLKYMRYKTFIGYQKQVEKLIDEWYTVRKYRMQIIVPIAFQYIQFCYSKSLKFFIENHEIPS
jgi:hypothetical protein